jgi:hypothetical protein
MKCMIINSHAGVEGIIFDRDKIVYRTGQQGCAEDADAEMANEIRRRGWVINGD